VDRQYTPDRATSLRHFLTVVFKRIWIITAISVLTLAAGAFKVFKMPDQYQAQAKLLLERDPELEKALLLRISSTGRSGEASYSYSQESEIMTSRPVLESVILSLGLYGFDDTTKFSNPREMEIALQMAVQELGRYLTISPSTDPNIIKVKFKSRIPKLCAEVVNELVERYIEYRFKIFSDDQSIAFLERQIEETAQQLNDLQQSRMLFQSEETLYTPDREGEVLFTRLKDYQNRHDGVRLERISKEAKLTTLKTMIQSGNYEELPVIELGDGNIQIRGILDLKSQLRDLEYERNRLRDVYTDSFVEVQEKEAEINALRGRINDEIKEIATVLESTINALRNEEATLRRSIVSIRNQISGLSGKELELQQLSRGITEKEELYSMLLKQREEARISQSKKEMVVRVKVISPAVVPIDPVPTNKWLKLVMVLLFGIFAGISIAFFTDFFDHSFKNAEDVQRYLDLDTLASIRSF